ncbi:MAG: DUF2752 domain-containing protein [Thermoanaerobaculia bacterium]
MNQSRQLGFLWGAVAVGLLALAPLAPRLATALPACPLKSIVGVPCLTCGSTRAALALGRLDLWTALTINPLVAAGCVMLVVGGLIAGVLALGGKPLREPSWRLAAPVRVAIALVLLANWVYLIKVGI